MNILLKSCLMAVITTLLLYSISLFSGFFGVFIMLFTPLPLLILGLRFGNAPAMLAASAAAFILSLFFKSTSAIAYFIEFAIPSVFMVTFAHQTNLSRFMLKTLLLLAGIATLIVVFYFGLTPSGLENYLDTTVLNNVFANISDEKTKDIKDLKDIFISILPSMSLMMWGIIMLGNFYLACLVLKKYNFMTIPNLNLLVMPKIASVLFTLAIICQNLPKPFATFASFYAATLALGYLLQGLAVLHFITRGKSWRTFFLVLVYLLGTTILGMIIPLALLFFGLADGIFNFRKLKDS